MRFVYGKQDMPTWESCQQDSCLLANGLGGYMALTAAFSANRCDGGVLVAAKVAPNDRLSLVHRLKEELIGGGEAVFLSTQAFADGTKEEDVSRALAMGRKDCVRLFEVMRKHLPGFKNARIRKIADNLGVRETRRIKGRYTVSIEDALSGARYEDTVAATTYNFDLPDPIKAGYDPMLGSTRNPKTDRKYIVIRIPYRSLIPYEIDNIIFAGRSISVCRDVMGAARIIGPSFMTGQAAGTAAALANGSFSSVDTDALRELLWKRGVLNPDTLPFD
jgi:hypothetical protein